MDDVNIKHLQALLTAEANAWAAYRGQRNAPAAVRAVWVEAITALESWEEEARHG